MDYTVGSVADLISGSKTPNKPKVVQKKFKTKLKPGIVEEKIDNENVTKVKKSKKRSISPETERIQNKKSRVTEPNGVGTEEINIPNKSKTKKIKKKNKENKPTENEQEEIPAENSGLNDETKEENTPTRKNSRSRRKKYEEAKEPINPDHVTIFVGNLPIAVTHKKLMKIFSKYGSVVNARIRGIPVADPKIPKKVAAIKKEFHPERKSVHGYVTFATLEDAQKALTLNGKEYKAHHIRVNITKEKQARDKTKAIFLGNLSFAAEEEELWQIFQPCGEIESVRLVRDRFTDVGKGFGYINFKSSDSVELALQMGEVKLRDRVIRVSLYNGKAPKKQKPQKQQKQTKKSKSAEQEDGSKAITTPSRGQFQGKFANAKKKNKFNKGFQQKKKLAKRIAPKTMSGSAQA